MIKIQFMPRWRKRKVIKTIVAESKSYSQRMKAKQHGWPGLYMTAVGLSGFIARCKAVSRMPLLKITIGNRALEISANYRFSTYRFWVINPDINVSVGYRINVEGEKP